MVIAIFKNTKKLFLSTLLVLFVSSFFALSIYAQEVSKISPADVSLDISAIRTDDNYTLPSQIVISPVYSTADFAGLSGDELYKGIYFYTVEMLGFNDIPYHYLVSEDGEIYEGNRGGDERKLRINGIGDDVLLVGYMTNKNSARFSNDAKESLKNLLTEVTNTNIINPSENISVSKVIFKRDKATRSVSIESDDLIGNWNTDLAEITNVVNLRYNPVGKTYAIGVNKVIAPTSPVKPGETVSISIDLSNLSENGIYGGSENELLLSKTTSGASQFFLNNEWVSTTQVPILSEGEYLLKLQNAIFDFNVRAPLYIGDLSETFDIYTLDGQKVNTEPVIISITIERTDRPIVEILNTETGTLNVRVEPSSVANSFIQVSEGQRFFKTNDAGNGWIEIELDDGRTGWIAGWYTREL